MSKPSKAELVSRIERVERATEDFHEVRKDLEAVTTALARLETKMDAWTQSRHEASTQKTKWSDTATVVASIIIACGVLLGGMIWVIKATTVQVVDHSQDTQHIVYVAPPVTAPKLNP